MPSRLVTAAILLFWLAMTGWLIQREVVPSMLADVAPVYQPDLTDEIGSPSVVWKIFRNGERVGTAHSRVFANEDRCFDFFSAYKFNMFHIGPVRIAEIEHTYRVSDDGKLRSFSTKMEVALNDLKFDGELKGEIADSEFVPRFFLNKHEEKLPNVEKVQFIQNGHFVNTMHLLNRVRGLREGKTWKINLPDLTGGVKSSTMEALFKQMKGPPELHCVVVADALKWDAKEVACYKIEYRERGKDDVVAQTWVRKQDGLVLQQASTLMSIEMVLQRMP